jgi:hypothetical protein
VRAGPPPLKSILVGSTLVDRPATYVRSPGQAGWKCTPPLAKMRSEIPAKGDTGKIKIDRKSPSYKVAKGRRLRHRCGLRTFPRSSSRSLNIEVGPLSRRWRNSRAPRTPTWPLGLPRSLLTNHPFDTCAAVRKYGLPIPNSRSHARVEHCHAEILRSGRPIPEAVRNAAVPLLAT